MPADGFDRVAIMKHEIKIIGMKSMNRPDSGLYHGNTNKQHLITISFCFHFTQDIKARYSVSGVRFEV